ncbi:MAG: GatB/YqeY domain-containing protein [Gammaproteobacteria bacterium]|nr:GatB/YqeY domain-containing protein [Gammaproteobacteria bacterium]
MALKDRITEDMKGAMRAGDRQRLAAIRLALAAIKQREVDERITLDDSQVLAVLEKMIKQRREAITQFESGGRADLVAKESAEIKVLQEYLPAQLGEAEIDALIAEAIAATGAASMKDMGKVMAAVKPRAQGRTDMGALSARIRQRLTGPGSAG